MCVFVLFLILTNSIETRERTRVESAFALNEGLGKGPGVGVGVFGSCVWIKARQKRI